MDDISTRFEFLTQFNPTNIIQYFNIYKFTKYNNGLDDYLNSIEKLQLVETESAFDEIVEEFNEVTKTILKTKNYSLIKVNFPNFNPLLQWITFQFTTNFKFTAISNLRESNFSDGRVENFEVKIRPPTQNERLIVQIIDYYPRDARDGNLEYIKFSNKLLVSNSNFIYNNNSSLKFVGENEVAFTLNHYQHELDKLKSFVIYYSTDDKTILYTTISTLLNDQQTLIFVNGDQFFKKHGTHVSMLNLTNNNSVIDKIQLLVNEEKQLLNAEYQVRTDILNNKLTQLESISLRTDPIFITGHYLKAINQRDFLIELSELFFVNYSQHGISISKTKHNNTSTTTIQPSADFTKTLSKCKKITGTFFAKSLINVSIFDEADVKIYELGYQLPTNKTFTGDLNVFNLKTNRYDVIVGVENRQLNFTHSFSNTTNLYSVGIIQNESTNATTAAMFGKITTARAQISNTFNWWNQRSNDIYNEKGGVDWGTYNFFTNNDPQRRFDDAVNNRNMQLYFYDPEYLGTLTQTTLVPNNIQLNQSTGQFFYFNGVFWQLTNTHLIPLTRKSYYSTFTLPITATIVRGFVVKHTNAPNEILVLFYINIPANEIRIRTFMANDFQYQMSSGGGQWPRMNQAPEYLISNFSCFEIVQSASNLWNFEAITQCGIVEKFTLSIGGFIGGPNEGFYLGWFIPTSVNVTFQTNGLTNLTTPITELYTNTFTNVKFGYKNGLLFVKDTSNTNNTYVLCNSLSNKLFHQNWWLFSSDLHVKTITATSGGFVYPVAIYTQKIEINDTEINSIDTQFSLVYKNVEFEWFNISTKLPIVNAINENVDGINSLEAPEFPEILYHLLKRPAQNSLNFLLENAKSTFVPHSFQLWYFVFLESIEQTRSISIDVVTNLIQLIIMYKESLISWFLKGLPPLNRFTNTDLFEYLKQTTLTIDSELEQTIISQYKFSLANSQIYYPSTDVRTFKNSTLVDNIFLQTLYSLLPYSDIIFDNFTQVIPGISITDLGASNVGTGLTNITNADSEFLVNSTFVKKFEQEELTNYFVNDFNNPKVRDEEIYEFIKAILFETYKTQNFNDMFVSSSRLPTTPQKLLALFKSSDSGASIKINLMNTPINHSLINILKGIMLANVFLFGSYSLFSPIVNLNLTKKLSNFENLSRWLLINSDMQVVYKPQSIIIKDILRDNVFLKLIPLVGQSDRTFISEIYTANLKLEILDTPTLITNIIIATNGTITSNIKQGQFNDVSEMTLKFGFRTDLKFDTTKTLVRLITTPTLDITGIIEFKSNISFNQVNEYYVKVIFNEISLINFETIQPISIIIYSEELIEIFKLRLQPNIECFKQILNSNVFTNKNVVISTEKIPTIKISNLSTINSTFRPTVGTPKKSLDLSGVIEKQTLFNDPTICGVLHIIPIGIYGSTTILFSALILNSEKFKSMRTKKMTINLSVHRRSEILLKNNLNYLSLESFFFGGQTVMINAETSIPSLTYNPNGINVWYNKNDRFFVGNFNVFLPQEFLSTLNFRIEFSVDSIIFNQVEFIV